MVAIVQSICWALRTDNMCRHYRIIHCMQNYLIQRKHNKTESLANQTPINNILIKSQSDILHLAGYCQTNNIPFKID